MDTLTHALSGALLARATEPRDPKPGELPRSTRLWVGFWAAAFPDIDFIIRFIDPLTYLTMHRGLTHSVLLLPLWSIALAFLFGLMTRGKYSWRALWGVVALGIGIHIVGDIITAFGTMILAPFSNWRAQFPTTFIIDPYFTSIILGGLIASAVWKTTRQPAVIGLSILVGYVGFQSLMHQRAVDVGEAYATRHQFVTTGVEAIPQPFSPFNWMIVISLPDIYVTTQVSLLRDDIPEFPPENANWLQQVNASYFPVRDAIWKRVPRFGNKTQADLAEPVWYSDTMAPYRHFALYPALYRVDQNFEGQCVWFNDLRFALAGRHMPFRYGACRKNLNAIWRIYRLIEGDDGQEIFDVIPH